MRAPTAPAKPHELRFRVLPPAPIPGAAKVRRSVWGPLFHQVEGLPYGTALPVEYSSIEEARRVYRSVRRAARPRDIRVIQRRRILYFFEWEYVERNGSR